jgi:hypothetical protein
MFMFAEDSVNFCWWVGRKTAGPVSMQMFKSQAFIEGKSIESLLAHHCLSTRHFYILCRESVRRVTKDCICVSLTVKS